MLKTVKIGKNEYAAIKAMAKKRGVFVQHLLNEAVRRYLIAEQQSKGETA